MRYMGGKARIAPKIVAYLESIRKPGQAYLEPFVGAANVISKMSGKRYGSDSHEDLILLLIAVRDGTIELPEVVSEELYKSLRHAEPSALRGFVGFGCSFGGKWFGGYARSKKEPNFAATSKRSIENKPLKGIKFSLGDYRTLRPAGMLIYCEPPYAGTTSFKGQQFDSGEFWENARKWSRTNTVIVSEYAAPSGLECVAEFPTYSTMTQAATEGDRRTEKLFRLAQ